MYSVRRRISRCIWDSQRPCEYSVGWKGHTDFSSEREKLVFRLEQSSGGWQVDRFTENRLMDGGKAHTPLWEHFRLINHWKLQNDVSFITRLIQPAQCYRTKNWHHENDASKTKIEQSIFRQVTKRSVKLVPYRKRSVSDIQSEFNARSVSSSVSFYLRKKSASNGEINTPKSIDQFWAVCAGAGDLCSERAQRIDNKLAWVFSNNHRDGGHFRHLQRK